MAARRGRRILMAAALILVITLVFAAGIGSVSISPLDVVQILLSRLPGISLEPSWLDVHERIIWEVRLPRVFLALLTGMALSVSGGAYQGLFQNALADPYILGVSAGAALGAAIAFAFGDALPLATVPILAFAGGLMAITFVYRLASVGRKVPVIGLLLAGIAVSSFCMALVSFVLYISKPFARESIMFWLMGGLSGANWGKVGWLFGYTSAGFAIMMLHGRELNALLMGEDAAHHLGVDVERVKRVVLAAGSLLTAATVAFCGAIGFIGLIVPHAVRLLAGPDHRLLLPISAVVGAIVLIGADTLARTVASPMEIPVGLVMAVLGGPFFLWLLRQKLNPTKR